MDAIPLNEPRYGIFDYQFKTNEAMSRNVERLLFIYWCPDTSKVSFKLPYSTGKEDIKKKLSGIGKHIEAQDISDVKLNIFYFLYLFSFLISINIFLFLLLA